MIQAKGFGGVEGVGVEHGLAIKAFLGVKHPQWALTRTGLSNGIPRVGARDGPVTAARDGCTRVMQRFGGVQVIVGRRTDVRLDQFFGVTLAGGPQQLHGGNDPQLLEAREVFWIDHLQVGEAMGHRRRVEAARISNAIEGFTYGTVTVRVHMHDPAALFCSHHQLTEMLRIDQQLTAFISVFVGDDDRCGLPWKLHDAVSKDLDAGECQIGHALEFFHHLGHDFQVGRLAFGVGEHQGGDVGTEFALLGQFAVERQHAVALLRGGEVEQRVAIAGV